MSKSRGNVVNPDDYVKAVGADTVRCYLMFIGPWDSGGPWNPRAISGPQGFLHRVWSLAVDPRRVARMDLEAERELRRLTNQTIRDATDDIERFRFNTLLSKLMSFSNGMQGLRDRVSSTVWDEALQSLLLLLAPLAPHVAEELWTAQLGKPYSIHQQSWPSYDEAAAAEEQITIPVTVNGKPRGELKIPASMKDDRGAVEAMALDLPRVKAMLNGAGVRKVIFVPGRVVNIVV